MKIASTKFLAITFAFIVYATILLLIMVTLPLHAQTNASAENGTNSPVAVTASVQTSNPIAATEPAVTNLGRLGTDFSATVEKLGFYGTLVVVIGLAFYFRNRRNKMAHETLRAMIEKGMPVTPELVAQLQIRPSRFSNQPGQSRHRRLLPGLILTGVGAALLITNLGRNSGDGKAGWIVLFIGAAFLIVWLVERKDKNNDQPPKP